jgi:uncharacterized protein YraI
MTRASIGAALAVVQLVAVAAAAEHANNAEVVTPVLLRERADEHAPIVARVPAGTAVTLVGQGVDGSWLQVRTAGRTGWANKGFFKVATPTAAPRAVASDDAEGPSLVAPRGRRTTATPPPAAPTKTHLEAWRRHDPPPPDDAAAEAATATTTTTTTPAAVPPEALAVTARPTPPDRTNALSVTADAGVAILQRRYASNGTGPLAAYQLSTTAAATGVSAGYTRRIGARGVVGVDLAYAYATGGGARYIGSTGSPVALRLQSHDAEAGLRLGVHSRAAGGIDVALRAGLLFAATVFDPDMLVRLTSDRLFAPTAGLGIDAPHLAAVGKGWLGVALFGRAVLDGRMSENIDEGSDRGTWGGRLGGRVTLDVWRSPSRGQVVLGAGYSYAFTVSNFAGPSQRDATATQATLGNAAHLATLSLGYAF